MVRQMEIVGSCTRLELLDGRESRTASNEMEECLNALKLYVYSETF